MKTTQDTDQKTVVLFAYGTLRADEPLHSWIADDIIRPLGTGIMRGAKLYYSATHRGYPYLVMTGTMSDEAVGELYEVPLNDQILSMFHMEMNAGYTVVDSRAMLEGQEVDVVVCAWRNGGMGDEVPNNDWCSTEREEWWA